MNALPVLRLIDKCEGREDRAVCAMQKLSDADFVAFVRQSKSTHPEWWTAGAFANAVHLEIHMRQLLRGGEGDWKS